MNVVVIPVKADSSRLPGKNFLPFGDSPNLTYRKIKQCAENALIDRVVVSSNSVVAAEIASDLGVEFVLRDDYFCSDAAPWHEVTRAVVSSVSEPGDLLVWAPATSPNFSKFDRAVSLFLEREQNGFDSLVSVTELRHYFLDHRGHPINYCFGYWHKASQQIDPVYQVNSACFVARAETFLELGYQIGRNPWLMPISPLEADDIDTEEDFKIAESHWMTLRGYS